MDWDGAIEKNTKALAIILAGLFAMIGTLCPTTPTLPRYLRSEVYRILRPAESALRRLINIIEWRMAIEVPARRAALNVRKKPNAPRDKSHSGIPPFQLFDPLKNFKPRRKRPKALPRIFVPGYIDPVFTPPKPEPAPKDLLDANPLLRRLKAAQIALDDLPKQALRLARKRTKGGRISVQRPGYPPGHRQRKKHSVDHILDQTSGLAAQVDDLKYQSRHSRVPTIDQEGV